MSTATDAADGDRRRGSVTKKSWSRRVAEAAGDGGAEADDAVVAEADLARPSR